MTWTRVWAFRCPAVTAIRITISSFTAMWGWGGITTRLTGRTAGRCTTTCAVRRLTRVRAAAITCGTTNLTAKTADIPVCKVLNLLDNIRLPFDSRSDWSHHNNYRHKAFGPPDSSLQDGQLK